MTLVMYDDIYTTNLPQGGDAYLGYVDGKWPSIHGFTENGITYPPLAQVFPGKRIIGLTVTGATLAADGCDIESGNLSPSSGAAWIKAKLATGVVPVNYCSIDLMPSVLAACAAIGVARSDIRLLSAHYGEGEHICGPGTCAYQGTGTPDCDATQWTDTAGGLNASLIDQSLVNDSFFGGPMAVQVQNGVGYCGKCGAFWYADGTASVCSGNAGGPHVAANPVRFVLLYDDGV